MWRRVVVCVLACQPIACSLVFPVDEHGRGRGDAAAVYGTPIDASALDGTLAQDAGGDAGQDALANDDASTEVLSSSEANPTSVAVVPQGIFWVTDTAVRFIGSAGPGSLGKPSTVWVGAGEKKLDVQAVSGGLAVTWSSGAELFACGASLCDAGVEFQAAFAGPAQSLATNGFQILVVDGTSSLVGVAIPGAERFDAGKSTRDISVTDNATTGAWVSDLDSPSASIVVVESGRPFRVPNLPLDTRKPKLGNWLRGPKKVAWLTGALPNVAVRECDMESCSPRTDFVGDVEHLAADGNGFYWASSHAGRTSLRACRFLENCSPSEVGSVPWKVTSLAVLDPYLYFTTATGDVRRTRIPPLP